MMPISDPRDRFFYPHHTPMKDTYNVPLFMLSRSRPAKNSGEYREVSALKV